MEINSDFLLQTTSKSTIDKKKSFEISQSVLDQAKKLSQKPSYTGVIVDNQVIGIDSDSFRDLQEYFGKKGLLKYEDVLIADGATKEYLKNVLHEVLVNQNVAGADKDGDRTLSYAESLDAKNIFDEKRNGLVSGRELFSNELIYELEQEDGKLATYDEIVNEFMKIDKNKDGKMSKSEASAGIDKPLNGDGSSQEDKLDQRLKAIEKQIQKVKSAMENGSLEENQKKALQEELGRLQDQKTQIIVQKQELLQKDLNSN